ncbi:MAG: FecR domain-containing protein [Oricola sp.]|jgi:transmembrane sensor|nr:FecR domain-containing protein [Oricola sp.]
MDKKENLSVIPDQKTIDAEAADWLVRLEEEYVSAEDRAAFLAWRSVSARHRDAFDRLAKLWDGFDQAKVLSDYAASDDNAALLASDAARARVVRFARRSVLTGIAASVALMAGVGIAVSISGRVADSHKGLIETAVGEQETVNLPDKSVIELNTNSQVAYVYEKDGREIKLMRGEAFFKVAPNKDQPFRVETPTGSVVAVGTAFTVRIENNKVDVLVSEGSVVFLPRDMASKGPVRPAELASLSETVTAISAGQAAVFQDRAEEQVDPIEPDAIARKLSWRQGVLAFSGDPLSDVVADVSRYTDVVIEIDDQGLRDLPVSGYFKIGEMDELFEALEMMAGLEAQQVGSKRVRLVRMAERN